MYNTYFGFTAPPFADPENHLFLNIPSQQAAFAYLRQGLTECRGLLLLTGVAGIGKTSLLRQLIADLKHHTQCLLFWNADLNFEDLLDSLCDDLGLDVHGSEQPQKIQALEACLVARLAEGRRVILILDDAHGLPEQTLEGLHQLARLEAVGRRLLQIVLSGRPELETRLAKAPALESLRRDVGGHYRLENLDDDGVIGYINERLHAAGYEGQDLFEADALDKVITYTQGIPRLINLICNQALSLAYLNSEKRISAKMVRKVSADQPHEPVNPALFPSPETRQVAHEANRSTPETRRPTPEPDLPIGGTYQLSHERRFPKKKKAASSRPPQPTRRRWPWLVLSMILLTAVGTVVALHSFDIPLDLNRLSGPLDQLSTSRTEKLPLPLPDIAKEPEPPALKTGAIPPLRTPHSSNTAVTEEPSITPAESPIAPEETTPLQEAPQAPSNIAVAPQAPASTTPDPALVERIETLLAAARKHMAAYRYTIPGNENALKTYQEVLRLDPDNAEALQGIEDMKSDYVRWADEARAQGDWAKAQRQLERALIVNPGDESVRRLLEELR